MDHRPLWTKKNKCSGIILREVTSAEPIVYVFYLSPDEHTPHTHLYNLNTFTRLMLQVEFPKKQTLRRRWVWMVGSSLGKWKGKKRSRFGQEKRWTEKPSQGRSVNPVDDFWRWMILWMGLRLGQGGWVDITPPQLVTGWGPPRIGWNLQKWLSSAKTKQVLTTGSTVNVFYCPVPMNVYSFLSFFLTGMEKTMCSKLLAIHLDQEFVWICSSKDNTLASSPESGPPGGCVFSDPLLSSWIDLVFPKGDILGIMTLNYLSL